MEFFLSNCALENPPKSNHFRTQKDFRREKTETVEHSECNKATRLDKNTLASEIKNVMIERTTGLNFLRTVLEGYLRRQIDGFSESLGIRSLQV